MKCFNHSERDAVGTCKGCCKALCHDCAIDLGHGLACKGVHEAMVDTYNMIISKNARVYGNAQRNSLIGPAFYALMGALFLAYSLAQGDGIFGLLSLLGLAFLAFGAICFFINRKTFGADRNVA